MNIQPGDHTRIALRTIATIAATALLTWLAEERFVSGVVFARDLSWVLSGALVLGVGLLVLLVCVIAMRFRDDRRDERARQVEPEIRDVISSCVAADTGLGIAYVKRRLRAVFNDYPEETSHCFLQVFLALKGQHGDKLSDIADSIGLREYWRRIYDEGRTVERVEVIRALAHVAPGEASDFLNAALTDPDASIRVEAARTLAEVGASRQVEEVYDFARTQSLLVKAVLAEDLRHNAVLLASGPLAADLTSEDLAREQHALDMLKAWSTSLSVSLDRLLLHENRALRIQALDLITPIQVTPETQKAVAANLSNEPPEVLEAAALAAGRLYLTELLPDLTRLLSGDHGRVCSAAARALSRMGHLEPLKERIRTGESPGAEAALEAFQMTHTGRGAYVRV